MFYNRSTRSQMFILILFIIIIIILFIAQHKQKLR